VSADILIVEDEMLVACEMEAILEENGYNCVGIVPDLTEAARYFRHPLDLALVDLNLRDGFTGPQIGEQLSRAGIPVIFVTANPASLGDGIAGTIGVLTKPTDEKTLIQAVSFALGRRAGRPVQPPSCMRLFG
jgi:DNA-binding response OmpR family regulator